MGVFFELILSGIRGHNRRMPKGYVTTTQAAQITGFAEQQIRDAIRSGVIKPEDLDRVGRTWLIREEALKDFKPRKKGRQKGATKT